MNFKMIGRFVAKILAVEAVFMVPAALISLAGGETASMMGFTASIGIILAIAGLLALLSKGEDKTGFYAKEGLVCVALSWIAISLLGALPFVISGAIPHYVDALFEIVSGFTTTGSSILSDVEALPKGQLYWRSFSHWLGGMGVLVFLLAVTPVGGRSTGFTMHLLRAESPGPNVGKLVPRMRETAVILYIIYIVLTVLDIICLLIGGLPLFDAVCIGFGTAGTGGFGIVNDSCASYSPFVQNVCTVFMLLFSVNFSCYYLILLGQFKNVFKDEELRLFVGIVAACILLIFWDLRGFYGSLGETLRHAAFQVASIVSTTGFATADFDLWPSFSKGILLFLMVMGASAGSTGGGLKVGRALLLLKGLRRNIRSVMNPNKVQVVRINGETMSERVLDNANAYLAAYVVIIIASFVAISLDEFSVATNVSAVLACFNNIGPGLDAVGPTCNYAGFSVFSKLVLILDMLLGRLEIFPMLVLFSRGTWKQ